ncbi:hypothetical protein Tco_0605525 [Tanacetum coccineum]
MGMLLIAQKEEARIQIQVKEFDLMAYAGYIEEIEEVSANCILMANLQQASSLDTQVDKASIYDSDGSAEVPKPDPTPKQRFPLLQIGLWRWPNESQK